MADNPALQKHTHTLFGRWKLHRGELLTPNDQKATLGTLINDLRAQAQAGKVVFAFKDNKESDSVDTVVSLMKRLWNSQTDRHGTGSFVHPSQIEAEAAVHIAITLCHFFTKGLITRKP